MQEIPCLPPPAVHLSAYNKLENTGGRVFRNYKLKYLAKRLRRSCAGMNTVRSRAERAFILEHSFEGHNKATMHGL